MNLYDAFGIIIYGQNVYMFTMLILGVKASTQTYIFFHYVYSWDLFLNIRFTLHTDYTYYHFQVSKPNISVCLNNNVLNPPIQAALLSGIYLHKHLDMSV